MQSGTAYLLGWVVWMHQQCTGCQHPSTSHWDPRSSWSGLYPCRLCPSGGHSAPLLRCVESLEDKQSKCQVWSPYTSAGKYFKAPSAQSLFNLKVSVIGKIMTDVEMALAERSFGLGAYEGDWDHHLRKTR